MVCVSVLQRVCRLLFDHKLICDEIKNIAKLAKVQLCVSLPSKIKFVCARLLLISFYYH